MSWFDCAQGWSAVLVMNLHLSLARNGAELLLPWAILGVIVSTQGSSCNMSATFWDRFYVIISFTSAHLPCGNTCVYVGNRNAVCWSVLHVLLSDQGFLLMCSNENLWMQLVITHASLLGRKST